MARPSHDPCDESPWFPPQGWWSHHEPSERLSRWRRLSIQAKRHLPPPQPSQEEDDRWLQRAAEQKRERKAAEAQHAAEAAKRYEEEQAAAVEAALHGDLESLPRVESITAEEFLALLGHDRQARFEGTRDLFNIHWATLVSFLSLDSDESQGRYILDCGYYEPGEIPDYDTVDSVLVAYEEDEARRYIAWAEAAEIFPEDRIHWLDFPEAERLQEMLPELEAQSLEQQADQLDQEINEDRDVLEMVGEAELDDLVDPGLEAAVDAGRAGRRMIKELDRQYHERDVARGGEEAVERKLRRSDKLRRTAAALRRRREEEGT